MEDTEDVENISTGLTYIYGHEVIINYESNTSRWKDNNELITDFNNHRRLCPRCKLPTTPEGHDACCPNLSGVRFACCGHGIKPTTIEGEILCGNPYYMLENGECKYFSTTEEFLEAIKLLK